MDAPDAVIARGTIRGHEAGGEAVLERTPEGAAMLHLVDHWIAQGAPDVRIYLTPDPEGDPDAEGAVDLGKATTFSGDASYAVPDDADLDAMRTAVVHCKVYSVIFGVAVLERTNQP